MKSKHWYCCLIGHNSLCPRRNRDNAIFMAVFTGLLYTTMLLATIFSPCMAIGEKIGTVILMSCVFMCTWICFVIPFLLEWSCYTDEEKAYMVEIDRC